MRHKITAIALLLFLAFISDGCGKRRDVYLETQEASEAKAAEVPETTFASEEAAQEEQTENVSDLCYVYVCGAVFEPGVYALPKISRIYEAIALAGGVTEEAVPDFVNQADIIFDGQMIKIPTWEELQNGSFSESAGSLAQGADEGTQKADDGLVNLNQASVETLMTLPGIGTAKAQSIVTYREKCGGFSSVEELMNVDGIKEGVFNRIKDYIKVN